MQAISLWIKIPYTLFVIVLVPVYWIRYGPANFLWFSDVGLFGTLVALWLESRFLLSMMATGVLLFDIVWNLIFFPKLLLDAGPEGVVGYMFDPEIALPIRALSLFHVALPIIQLWSLRKMGYDVRAWKYQSLLGCIILALTYSVSSPEKNINWVFGVIEAPQKWLPAPLYLAALMGIYPILVCFPTHLVLKRLFYQSEIEVDRRAKAR
ncbi:MAG TPA: membrane-associated protein [Candidatus Binatia bacterium]|nr:membrane-associated protein [Candidatus Binatia bacterium]